MIKVYSFFSGIGFLDFGFEKAGFNIVFVNEINKKFLEAYKFARQNIEVPPVHGYSDKSADAFLNDKEWEKISDSLSYNDIFGFIGGPPCPDFSVAGVNEGCQGKNGQLTQTYVDLIKKRKPDFFVFENVKGLYTTKKHREFFEKIKNELANVGYRIFESVENALSYGVPQNRDRLFLVGFKKEVFLDDRKSPLGMHRKIDIDEIKKIQWPDKNKFQINSRLECPTGVLRELTVEYWFEKNKIKQHKNCNDIFKVKNIDKFMSIQEGDTKGKSFKRLHRWRFAPTAAYGHNEVPLHPYLPRRISVSEALAIQSLPVEFALPEGLPLSTKFKMISNGVPYLLSLGIAKDVMEYINKNFKR